MVKEDGESVSAKRKELRLSSKVCQVGGGCVIYRKRARISGRLIM